jgi:hypothetical protein
LIKTFDHLLFFIILTHVFQCKPVKKTFVNVVEKREQKPRARTRANKDTPSPSLFTTPKEREKKIMLTVLPPVNE